MRVFFFLFIVIHFSVRGKWRERRVGGGEGRASLHSIEIGLVVGVLIAFLVFIGLAPGVYYVCA